jgi:hypothetical protein
MRRVKTERRASPAERGALLCDVVGKARRSVAPARAVLAAAERVVTMAEALQAADDPEPSGLRRALNDLGVARRSLEPALIEMVEAADRVLDALGSSTRHVLR